ncbi:hypothetical protein TNCV_976711 [Trichonephila clavipes]|nr:hypothetical protein TNCV_976711 [Trichonephila clavipes]
MAHIIRLPDDNVVKKILHFKVTGIWKRGNRGEIDKLSGIRLWDYKRETLENESKQEVTGEIFKGRHWLKRAVLPNMIMMMIVQSK